MRTDIARKVMALATGSLRRSRPEWAAAMHGEFEEAVANGAALRFALGCLTTAWRELPFHGEGRLRLTSFAVAIGLVAPIAALNLLCSLPGFSFLLNGQDHYYATLVRGTSQQRELAEAYRAGVPVITIGIVFLGLLHFQIAWAILRRRFGQLTLLWPLTGLVAGVLLAVAVRLFPHGMGTAPTVFLGLAVELVSVPGLVWWQRRLRHRAATDRRA